MAFNEKIQEKEEIDLSLLIDVIHKFSQRMISSRTEEEVFKILVEEVAENMNFLDCVVYKVNDEFNVLKQVAAFGPAKISKSDELKNPLALKFGQGHAGKVAQTGTSMIVDDVTKSDDYIFDVVQAGSEVIVPVKINNKVYAVITSEHPDKNFYNEDHKKLLEVITSIVVGALVKIHEAEELEKVKNKLEMVLHKKSDDLDMAIETLSTQYSELKYQQEKQITLFKEVHHRVTNNLQIISSILRLYINESDKESVISLKAVHDRVQSMALIHQNIYRSMESKAVDINSYIFDLVSYLKSTTYSLNVEIDVDVENWHFPLEVLVSIGLYITEIYYFWIYKTQEKESLSLLLCMNRSTMASNYVVSLIDKSSMPFKRPINLEEGEDASTTMISALVDQLEGEFTSGFDKGNFMKLVLN